MTTTDLLGGLGTAESTWRPWLQANMQSWPCLEIGDLGPPVVVAPHPDDEVLAAGGLLALATDSIVVGLTNGEASHPDSPTCTPEELGQRRRTERSAALERLRESSPGGGARLIECGFPDGRLDQYKLQLIELIGSVVPEGGCCVAPWWADGHPDHDAVGRAAATACSWLNATLLLYPVWSWHWSRPGDPSLPWDRATCLSLPGHVLERKAAAINEFTSQITPLSDAAADGAILPPPILDRFRRPYEVFFRCP